MLVLEESVFITIILGEETGRIVRGKMKESTEASKREERAAPNLHDVRQPRTPASG
jgi:hypothetical protein